MKKATSKIRTRRGKEIKKARVWRHYIGSQKKKKNFYNCPFCEQRRIWSDRTAIHDGREWIQGCQNCFLHSIDEPADLSKQQSNL